MKMIVALIKLMNTDFQMDVHTFHWRISHKYPVVAKLKIEFINYGREIVKE